MIESQQAVEDLSPGSFGDGVSNALFSLVEVVAEIEIGPAIRGGDGVVHLGVQRAEGGDVVRDFVRRVEAVVRAGQSLTAGDHDVAAVRVVAPADGFEPIERGWEWKGLEAVRGNVLEPSLQRRRVSSGPSLVN